MQEPCDVQKKKKKERKKEQIQDQINAHLCGMCMCACERVCVGVCELFCFLQAGIFHKEFVPRRQIFTGRLLNNERKIYLSVTEIFGS